MKRTLIDLAAILPADLANSPDARMYVLGAVMGQDGVHSFERVNRAEYRVRAADTDGGLQMAHRAAASAARTLVVVR